MLATLYQKNTEEDNTSSLGLLAQLVRAVGS